MRSTAAPYTESRLARLVPNKRVGFPVVEQPFRAKEIAGGLRMDIGQQMSKMSNGHTQGMVDMAVSAKASPLVVALDPCQHGTL